MSLNRYILNGPSVVILDDDRDPRVSWQHHLDRTGGLRPGVDLVARVGTPVLAPTPGIMDRRPDDGSAGNSCRFKHDLNPGWADVFSHLSSYVGRDYQHFEQGEVIAYTGNSGGVAEHLHRHLLDPAGVRRFPWDFWSAAPAGLDLTPIALGKGRKMQLEWTTDGTGWLVTEQGWTGLPGMQVYNLFRRVINSNQGADRPDTFLRAEVDMMNAQLRLLALANNVQATIDPVKLAAAISSALPGKLTVTATLPADVLAKLADLGDVDWAGLEASVKIDPEVLAAAFNAAVPRVAAAIVKQSGALLSAAAG